jgi:hypothetical protein
MLPGARGTAAEREKRYHGLETFAALPQRRKMMAKKSLRGRKQDRARVAGGQDYEVRYEAKKTGKSKARVKRAVKEGRAEPQKGGTRAWRVASPWSEGAKPKDIDGTVRYLP